MHTGVQQRAIQKKKGERGWLGAEITLHTSPWSISQVYFIFKKSVENKYDRKFEKERKWLCKHGIMRMVTFNKNSGFHLISTFNFIYNT
jgi:hypothetical protein